MKIEKTENKNKTLSVEEIFARLQVIYGYPWLHQHKSEHEWRLKKTEWGEALSDLTIPEINWALRLCAREKSRLPTLPEFRTFAKQMPRPELLEKKDSHENRPSLAELRQMYIDKGMLKADSPLFTEAMQRPAIRSVVSIPAEKPTLTIGEENENLTKK